METVEFGYQLGEPKSMAWKISKHTVVLLGAINWVAAGFQLPPLNQIVYREPESAEQKTGQLRGG